MTTNTPRNGFRVPQLTDAPNIETAVGQLASDVDKRSFSIYATPAARDLANPTPTQGNTCFVQSYNLPMVYYNSYWGFWPGTPLALLYSDVDQTVGTAIAGTAMVLQNEVFDLISGHSTVTNTSRYTPPIPGNYRFEGGGSFDTAITIGVRTCRFVKNNVTNLLGPEGYSPTSSDLTISVSVRTAQATTMNGTTDYVELFLLQDSGSPIDTDASVNPSRNTVMMVTYLGGA